MLVRQRGIGGHCVLELRDSCKSAIKEVSLDQKGSLYQKGSFYQVKDKLFIAAASLAEAWDMGALLTKCRFIIPLL